jgi:hypothetical protein
MAPTNCGECELPLRWEQIEYRRGLGERWLAICACGMPSVFFPGRPDYEPGNPLRAALLAGAAPAGSSPPWIRLFQLSSGYPWWLPWRHVAGACAGCAPCVTFAVWTSPAPDRRAYSALCLACGQVTRRSAVLADIAYPSHVGSRVHRPRVALERHKRSHPRRTKPGPRESCCRRRSR